MFGKKEEQPVPDPNPLASIDTVDLRRAENASEILFGLARVLEEHGRDPKVTKYVRDAANAVRDITDLDIERSDDGKRDHIGAWEHTRQITWALKLEDNQTTP